MLLSPRSVLLRWLLVSTMIAVFGLPSAQAQQGSGGLDLDRLTSQGKLQASLTQLLTSEQVPTDNVVDPAAYVVGPGDILGMQTSGLDLSEKLIVVTPENTVIVERYGIIDVGGRTLQEVRDTLMRLVKARTPHIDVYVTLRRARLVYVTVSGNVPYPGTLAVPASMRVSTLLNVARQPWLLRRDGAATDLARQERSSSEGRRLSEVRRGAVLTLSGYASRNIIVRHRVGSTPVDLVKARQNGYGALDPHVREGDDVYVPFDDATAPTVSIGGAVVEQNTISWKPGDRVSTVLSAGGGIRADADRNRIRVVSPDGNGSLELRVDSTMTIIGNDPEISPGTAIIVERQVFAGGQMRQGVVDVVGEVSSPGGVLIVPGTTRLTEVLAQAGGTTTEAALALAYVVRPEPMSSQQEYGLELYRRFQYSDLELEDTLRYRLDQQLRIPYVSCDVAAAVAKPDGDQNIVMQHGDVLIVPRRPDRIYVYGQVSNPGYVTYVPGRPIEWYIEAAGGFAKRAVPARARIIKGRSKVWVEQDDGVMVEPGDEVYVPRKLDVPAGMEIQTYAVIAGVVSSVTALIGLFYTILR